MEIMGYDQEKVQAEIDDVIALYRKHLGSDYKKAREIISRHTAIIPTITGLCTTNATDGRRAELLKNPVYISVLDKYR